MSIDFSTVKSWNIPEGEVLSASLNGVTIYTKPVEHTYEPTSQNGDGLYGLVDGVYYPLTATSTTVTTYTYDYLYNGTRYTASDTYKPYIKKTTSTGTTYQQYSSNLKTISSSGSWQASYFYYFVTTGTYKTISRYSSSSYVWSYTLPDGTPYTGQRYIQTS